MPIGGGDGGDVVVVLVDGGVVDLGWPQSAQRDRYGIRTVSVQVPVPEFAAARPSPLRTPSSAAWQSQPRPKFTCRDNMAPMMHTCCERDKKAQWCRRTAVCGC